MRIKKGLHYDCTVEKKTLLSQIQLYSEYCTPLERLRNTALVQ